MAYNQFPSGQVSASDIRTIIAGSNTGGAQTPVNLNDGPVRAVSVNNTGAVSMSNLRNKIVLFSGRLTFGYYADTYLGNPYNWGYNRAGTYPAGWGSINNTTYYYRQPSSTILLNRFSAGGGWDRAGGQYRNWAISFSGNISDLAPVYSQMVVNVNIDGTNYTAAHESGTPISSLYGPGDAFGLESRVNTTCHVVIYI